MTASSKQPAKNSPHSRFIPREEVEVFSPWEFQSMDGKPPKGSTAAAPVIEAPPAPLEVRMLEPVAEKVAPKPVSPHKKRVTEATDALPEGEGGVTM